MSSNLQEIFKHGNVLLVPPSPEDPVYDQVFGAGYIPQIDWEKYLPEKETQEAIPFCVSFSRLNAAEAVANQAGLSALNLSDRHLGVSSNTNKVGNSLQVVSETFRKNGIVKEEELPFTKEMLTAPFAHWDEIFDTSNLDPLAKRYYGGNHSWVYGKEAMKQALAFSPLQIAIGVPSTYNDPIIKDTGKYYSYHAVLLYKIDDAGYYYIYDSIGPNFKRVLDKDFKIEQAKSFRDLPENWKELDATIFNSIRAVFGEKWLPSKVFYERKLIDKGIYGAVRVTDSKILPAYRVFTIGPGGSPVQTAQEYKDLFGTLSQNGIVGIITESAAKKLGINIASGIPIELEQSDDLVIYEEAKKNERSFIQKIIDLIKKLLKL